MLNPPVPISVKSCPVARSNDIATVISAVDPAGNPQIIVLPVVGDNLIPAVALPSTSVPATRAVSIYQTLLVVTQRPPLVYAVYPAPFSVLVTPASV